MKYKKIFIIGEIFSLILITLSSSSSILPSSDSNAESPIFYAALQSNVVDEEFALRIFEEDSFLKIIVQSDQILLFSKSLQTYYLEIYQDLYGNLVKNYEFSIISEGIFINIFEYLEYFRVSIVYNMENRQLGFDSYIEKTAKTSLSINPNLLEKTIQSLVSFSFPIDSKNFDLPSNSEVKNQLLGDYGAYHFNIVEPKPSVTSINYFIIEQCADYDEIDIDGLLSDARNNPGIDYAFTRYIPTETRVKADIQYYTKDIYRNYRLISSKNIVGFEIIAHGGTQWELCGDKFRYAYDENGNIIWGWKPFGIIFPDEIENIWGDYMYGSELFVYYAESAIIFPFTCHGYIKDAEGVSGMKEAWVDVGNAESFVGSTIPILKSYTEEGTETFWNSMITGSSTYAATCDLCDICPDWNYNFEWKIYGTIWGYL